MHHFSHAARVSSWVFASSRGLLGRQMPPNSPTTSRVPDAARFHRIETEFYNAAEIPCRVRKIPPSTNGRGISKKGKEGEEGTKDKGGKVEKEEKRKLRVYRRLRGIFSELFSLSSRPSVRTKTKTPSMTSRTIDPSLEAGAPSPTYQGRCSCFLVQLPADQQLSGQLQMPREYRNITSSPTHRLHP